MALQQRGFYNMTLKFFGTPDTLAGTVADKPKIDALFSLWPKGNGDDHRIMFRKMITGATKVLISWGQNPAVTEPNQGAIRSGLENLDLLVVTDMFETETAACDRKATGVTYLIPAAAHVEVGGSATNSGRTLQWRYQARKPAGNSKSDLELLFRLAYALDGAGAFSHISAAWGTAGVTVHVGLRRAVRLAVRERLEPAERHGVRGRDCGCRPARRNRGRHRQRRVDAHGHRLRVGSRDDLP